jgi:hypothetical protein
MGKAGRNRVAAHFSADAVIRKTDVLYQSLLAGSKQTNKITTPLHANARQVQPILVES